MLAVPPPGPDTPLAHSPPPPRLRYSGHVGGEGHTGAEGTPTGLQAQAGARQREMICLPWRVHWVDAGLCPLNCSHVCKAGPATGILELTGVTGQVLTQGWAVKLLRGVQAILGTTHFLCPEPPRSDCLPRPPPLATGRKGFLEGQDCSQTVTFRNSARMGLGPSLQGNGQSLLLPVELASAPGSGLFCPSSLPQSLGVGPAS